MAPSQTHLDSNFKSLLADTTQKQLEAAIPAQNLDLLKQAIVEDTTKPKEVTPAKTKDGKLMLSKLQLAEILQAQTIRCLEVAAKAFSRPDRVVKVEALVNEDKALVRALEIRTSVNGVASPTYRKAYGFTHPEQVKNEGEWKLTLWQNALESLISGGVLYSLVLAEARKEDPGAFIQ